MQRLITKSLPMLALLTVCLTRAAGVLAAPQMVTCETAHYTVETDISPQVATLIGRHMEAIFQEYSRRFQDYGRVSTKFHVAVFSREADYLQAVPPEARGSTGVFVSAKQLLAAQAEDRTMEDVMRTLYHEGFHQFMWEVIAQDPPVWLNEGIAEYFSEATWNGQGFGLGQVPTDRLFVIQTNIRNGTHIRLARFFEMSLDKWLRDVRTDSRRASLQYSEAWSIVQFLVHADNGRYLPMLNTFMHDIARGRIPEQAFRDSFGVDLAGFESAWARYTMSLKPSPKFQCRDNMESILLLAQMTYTNPRLFTEMSDLRYRVLRVQEYRWEITRATGEKLSSDDMDKVAQLFRCPFDRGSRDTSYVLVRNRSTQMPILVCAHHPGVATLAYFKRKPDGDWGVVVEEQVDETLSLELRQAIGAAAR